MTTVNTIQGWLERARKEGATHMLVVCDTFDYEDYPVFVMPNEDVHERYKHFNGPNMQRVMEVYNLSIDIDGQLNADRAKNF